MTPPSGLTFHERARRALADTAQRAAFDRVTARFVALRRQALSDLPEAEAVRDRARRIRAHTLGRLDHYLAKFADALQAHGGQVHWAADAPEARAIVLEIARRAGARRVVKSKSMLSEEIHLNPALEQAGLEVVESDLGEYIIQLRGDTPSHIITPAVHLMRGQIGQLLHDKIGLPLTDDPAQMTAGVRARMRRVFLEAEVGISGVNFAVAETGTLCLVTNEGNGRLTTSLPRVHIALLGMERLVPGLDDLSVMLQVLARSATGQPLSVYTSLLTGPRRAGEPDGPDELHVVVVDNGRSRVLASELREILYCIRCGACLNACPVYREIGGHAYGSVYPGPVGAVLAPALDGLQAWPELPHASSLCGACRDVCPVRIDLPGLLLKLRRQGDQQGHTPRWLGLGLQLFAFAAVRPALFHLGARLAALGTGLLARGGWLTRLPPPLDAWTASRDFPAFASRTFSQQLREARRRRRGG